MSRFSISSDDSSSSYSTINLEASGLAIPATIHPKSEKQEVWQGTQDNEKDSIKHYRHFSIQLPPPDRGYRAWGYLLGAFIVEALCWGFPLSFGVFSELLNLTPAVPR